MALRRPDVGACFANLAGGCLGFSGTDVPLTRAVGVVTSGAIKSEDVEAVEQFYRSKNAPIRIAMSGLSDESLRTELSKRGYQSGTLMENWWRPVVDLPPPRIAQGIEVRRVTAKEADVWVQTVVAGFEEANSPVDENLLSPSLLDMFYCLGFADGVRAYLALRDGVPVGGSVLYVDGDTAHLRTTSCRFRHRRHGVQTALLSIRLQDAQNAGCRFVFSSTEGLGTSARNLERFGLQPLSISYLMSKAA